MSLILQAALMVHLLLLRNAFSCESYEYSTGGQCCPKCDPGNHMQVKERCDYSRNTKCTCQPGFFCLHHVEADSCDVCMRHTISPPGFRVTQAGTENHDVRFEVCPPGTFSPKAMSYSCIKWTNCSEKGLIETHKGNTTSDVVCEPLPGKNLALILSLVVIIPLVLVALLIILFCRKRKYPMKVFGKKKAEEAHYTGPEKECMVTPIQETAPNVGQPSYANC
ncbi:tumor necrosis factor receptor superfamily member 14 isoform X2 [Erythrolamprus reginae]|uniref:tumor necrosis factor receptor superfamily member 14 isoform X2 n=1 Tax=Erythrolamprus reginae TaxID=121349 RepID=UPI00396CC225